MTVELQVRRRNLKRRLFGMEEANPRLGHYRVEARIGAGAMGTVYRAWDENLRRHVALKLVRTTAQGEANRVAREARALAALAHPNVVTVHEIGEAQGRTFLAMELVDGLDLRKWLEVQRPIAERLRALNQAAEGIAAAHDAGLLHRDIKPENILVGRDGRVRVADFGLVATPGELEPQVADTHPIVVSVRTTATGRVVGTPAYMAPELLAGSKATRAADQFALCCVAWEVLVGRHPFAASSQRERPVGARPRGVSRALWAAIERGLSPDPEDRAPSLASLIDALGASRRPPSTAVVAVLGAVVGAVLVSTLASPAPNESKSTANSSDAIEWNASTYCRDVNDNRAHNTALPLALPGLLIAAACSVAAPDSGSSDPEAPEQAASTSRSVTEQCVAAIDSEPVDPVKLEMMTELLSATNANDPERPTIHFKLAQGELLAGAASKGCTHLVLAVDQAQGELGDEARVVHEACCSADLPVDVAAARSDTAASGCPRALDAEAVCRDATATACCVNASVPYRVRWAQAKQAADDEAMEREKATAAALLEIGCDAGHDEACDGLRTLQ